MISLKEAHRKLLSGVTPLGPRSIPLEKALSYVLFQDVKADRPLPPYNRVIMDGFAVKSSDFSGSTATLLLKGNLQAGVASSAKLEAGQTIQVMTGSPLPEGADAVVMVEKSRIEGNSITLTEENIKPGLNIAFEGEDAEQGQTLIKAGSTLKPPHIAACASVGLSRIEVFKKPNITVISTGTEIIPPSGKPLFYQIRDCNSYFLRSFLNKHDLENRFLGIGSDDKDLLSKLIRDGLNSDMLMLTGGVSMGEYDFVPELLKKLSVREIFHKVRVKPGKPVWFGKSEEGIYVLALPGNPVSVQTSYKLFAEPLIRKISGDASPLPFFLHLTLAADITKASEREQYIPARLCLTDGQTSLEETVIHGSGDYASLAESDGLIRCPAEVERLKAGSTVKFLPWNSL